ncbi:zf-HC2 domain-containing protein [Nocardiopsis composta]|uniref:Anti-sigma factor RsiW n=1 Tax=Nocardiopsis composta TaxID=157465 RepID=A0A7W8QNT1_9ACTN|nr:zf-HC2 domain-containing protein [Nocardiopsis composta]MBB5433858.1 anti-sigma factor RsiW [Nocardiopsis composta]
MRCIDCRTALSAELDGEDPGSGPGAVRRHLGDRPSCADRPAGLHELEALVAAARRPSSGGRLR